MLSKFLLVPAFTCCCCLPAFAMGQVGQHMDHHAMFRSLKEGKKNTVFTIASDDAEFRSNCVCWFEDGKKSCSGANCELLIHPRRDIVFESEGIKLDIGAGALVLLAHQDGKISVYNLHDTKYGAVSFHESDGAKKQIHVGESVAVNAEGGPLPRPEPFTLSTIAKCSPLVSTMKSEMSSGDKAMWKTLVKTYASLSMIRGDHTLEAIYHNAECYNKGSLKVR